MVEESWTENYWMSLQLFMTPTDREPYKYEMIPADFTRKPADMQITVSPPKRANVEFRN
jgi:hypothetical protein